MSPTEPFKFVVEIDGFESMSFDPQSAATLKLFYEGSRKGPWHTPIIEAEPTPRPRFDVAKAVRNISLKHFPMPVKLVADYLGDIDAWKLVIECKVPDRDNGEQIRVMTQATYPSDYLDTESTVIDIIHRLLLDCLRHELDETFVYQGRRVFDPHRRE
jgi:hypothetical protein